MSGILDELASLGGVQHGCILKEGRVLASNFPSLLSENLASIARIVDRIFRGADSVRHSCNEVYFETDESYLLGFPLEGGFLVLLLTGKDVNFALIHMTVLSAAAQISMELAPPVREGATSSRAAPGRRAGGKIDYSLKPHLNGILEALTLQIGPAARICMGEGLKRWRSSCEPSRENLPRLIEILAEDIEDEYSRRDFVTALAGVGER